MKKTILGGFIGGLIVLLAIVGYVYFGIIRPYHQALAEGTRRWERSSQLIGSGNKSD